MRRSVRPVRTPATQTAQAPVPQASVSPEPRSQVRWRTVSRLRTSMNSTLVRLGKRGSVSICGPTPRTSSSVALVDERDAVGVAHRDAGDGERAAGDFERRVDRRIAGERRGNLAAGEDRLAHVDADALDLAGAEFEVERGTACRRRRSAAGRGGDAVVVDVLGDAADAVAAHFGLGAVGVEHPHLGVGAVDGADQDQAVGADAEVAIGDRAGEGRGVGGNRLAEAIDVDVVVAGAVHFGEEHGGMLDASCWILGRQCGSGQWAVGSGTVRLPGTEYKS